MVNFSNFFKPKILIILGVVVVSVIILFFIQSQNKISDKSAIQEGITFKLVSPQDKSTVNNPVVFSQVVKDTAFLYGPKYARYIELYVDDKKITNGNESPLYERQPNDKSVINNYTNSDSLTFSPGTHKWFLRIYSKGKTIYKDSPIYSFTVSPDKNSYSIQAEPETPRFYMLPDWVKLD